ncbi:MAG: nuclear transport factor 2 family protein [Pseudomonadota bacterium]
MTLEEEIRCERECTRLSNDFAFAVDRGHFDDFIALFAPDGALERRGEVLRGPQALRGFLEAMPKNRTMRHICTNIRIDMTSPTSAKGTSSTLMMHVMADAGTPLPMKAATPLCAEYEDEYVLTGSGWKFKYRNTIIVFQP